MHLALTRLVSSTPISAQHVPQAVHQLKNKYISTRRYCDTCLPKDAVSLAKLLETQAYIEEPPTANLQLATWSTPTYSKVAEGRAQAVQQRSRSTCFVAFHVYTQLYHTGM
ncbi:uncharacterized protein ZBAI_02154 [Zygosaccharomyces bailii ISA1307]|nr:uncharacterized protein ZBAI_02154 [Zygosaccharomyces bailii ISA1307]